MCRLGYLLTSIQLGKRHHLLDLLGNPAESSLGGETIGTKGSVLLLFHSPPFVCLGFGATVLLIYNITYIKWKLTHLIPRQTLGRPPAFRCP